MTAVQMASGGEKANNTLSCGADVLQRQVYYYLSRFADPTRIQDK